VLRNYQIDALFLLAVNGLPLPAASLDPAPLRVESPSDQLSVHRQKFQLSLRVHGVTVDVHDEFCEVRRVSWVDDCLDRWNATFLLSSLRDVTSVVHLPAFSIIHAKSAM